MWLSIFPLIIHFLVCLLVIVGSSIFIFIGTKLTDLLRKFWCHHEQIISDICSTYFVRENLKFKFLSHRFCLSSQLYKKKKYFLSVCSLVYKPFSFCLQDDEIDFCDSACNCFCDWIRECKINVTFSWARPHRLICPSIKLLSVFLVSLITWNQIFRK